MPAEKRLVIDIGTNSVLALLARVDGDKLDLISDRKSTTRLGDGLITSGQISEQAIRRTANAVAAFAREAEYDQAFLLGTEALRVAKNSDEFASLLRSETGLDLYIITGLKEAELSFIGAKYNLPLNSPNILLVDVGGGSTELVLASNDEIRHSASVPIGALKLLNSMPNDTEDTFGYFTGRGFDYLIYPLSEFSIPDDATIVATGGTITSAAAIEAGLYSFDAGRVHGAMLSWHQINDLGHQFERAGPEIRKTLIPFDPERAELILPGLGIFLAFMSIIERDSLIVSSGGLRFGAALRPDKIFVS